MLTLPRRLVAIAATGAAVTAIALPSASADQLIGRHMVMGQIAPGRPTFGNLTKIPMSLGKRVFGAYSDFQGGSIYSSPQTGAHPVWGAVKQVFDQAGGLARYGWPITDEINTGGRFVQRFQNGEISWP